MVKWPNIDVKSREKSHRGVKTYESTRQGRSSDVNFNFYSSISGIYGNSLCVFSVDDVGDMANKLLYIHGHSEVINDIEWSPMDDNVLASASDDNLIKFWRISGKSSLGADDYFDVIQPSQRGVTEIKWNPRVEGLILSSSRDLTTSLWDLEKLQNIGTVKISEERIFSTSWDPSGSYFGTSSLNSYINVYDPRKTPKNIISIKTNSHQHFRVLFLGGSHHNLISQVGYSRHCDRRMTLWDIRMPTDPWRDVYIDSQHGHLIPFFDTRNQIMYIFSKGSATMNAFNIVDESSRSFRFPTEHCSVASMPSRGLEAGESMRFYRNVLNKALIEPVAVELGNGRNSSPPLGRVSVSQWIKGEDKNGISDKNTINENFTKAKVQDLQVQLVRQKAHYEYLLTKKDAEITNLSIELDRLHKEINAIYDL